MVDYSAEDLAALATAIYGEARSEPRRGQDAVAHVIIGRSRRADVPIPHVVYGSVRSQSGQYSFTNPGEYSKTIGNPPKNDPRGWAKVVAVAKDALTGRTKDPTGGASHYFNPRYNSKQSDKWAKSMEDLGMIGNHQFFRERDGGVGITRAAANSKHLRQPGEDHIRPGIFGHDVMSAFDGYRGPAIPVPGGRGVSQADNITQSLMLDPHSDDMGLAARQEPAWSDMFAPGGDGLLGAPKSAIAPTAPQPDGFYESRHPVDAMGYPTEAPKSALTPRNDYPVAAPTATRAAPQSRLDKSFTRSVPMGPESALTPGTSDTARAAAARQLADSMRQAGVRGLDGQAAPQSAIGRERYGTPHVEHGLSTPPPQSNLFAPRAAAPAVTRAAPRSALSDTRLADSLGQSIGPAPISALGSIPTPTTRPSQSVAPKSAMLDIPVPTARPAQTVAPQSAIQSPVTAGREASRQSIQSTIAAPPPISALDNPMTGYDPHDGKPAPRSTVGQKFGVPAGRAIGAVAGAALAGPLGAVIGHSLGKSIADNRTKGGRFPAAPFAPANTFPVAPKAPPKSNFAGGPGSNGLSSYGNQARSDSGQFADAWSGGGLGLY